MTDLVIADQEFARAMKSLGADLVAIKRICRAHADILRSVADYAGFQSAEFALSIDTYAPQVKAIGDGAEKLAERVLENTSLFVQNVDQLDTFIY